MSKKKQDAEIHRVIDVWHTQLKELKKNKGEISEELMIMKNKCNRKTRKAKRKFNQYSFNIGEII